MILCEFQNGKMSLYCSKIDQDRAKNVKREILHFLLYLGQFLCCMAHFTIKEFSKSDH